MKNRFKHLLLLAFAVGCLGVYPAQANDSAVKPEVADKFGEVIDIEAEFVDKPRDYYSEMCVSEPYFLKVLSVNGKPKPEPLIIQYEYLGTDKDKIVKGVKYRFRAYEDIYSRGMAHGWAEDWALEQIPYGIENRLVIKNAKKPASGN